MQSTHTHFVETSLRVTMGFLHDLYLFSRPHTIVGTTLSVLSTSLVALRTAPDRDAINTDDVIAGIALAWVCSLLMNVYIVGLNQVYDIDIDKTNKPYLPLASGHFSLSFGIGLVSACFVASVSLSLLNGASALFWVLTASAALGTAYSTDLPLLRWKRYPFLASMCIFVVRGIIVPIGFYCHMAETTPQIVVPWYECRTIQFSLVFFTVLSLVIALFKDIPDVKGDEEADVRTLPVRLGARPVLKICTSTLLVAYAIGVAFSLRSPWVGGRIITVVGHLLAAAYLAYRGELVDLESKASVRSFYMLIWKVFYAEYLLVLAM